MKWLKDLFKHTLDEVRDIEEQGPLCGLSPPEGCYFEVRRGHDGDAWFVEIKGPTIKSREFYGVGLDKYHGKHHKDVILRAANEALRVHNDAKEVAYLQGSYPPKRI